MTVISIAHSILPSGLRTLYTWCPASRVSLLPGITSFVTLVSPLGMLNLKLLLWQGFSVVVGRVVVVVAGVVVGIVVGGLVLGM